MPTAPEQHHALLDELRAVAIAAGLVALGAAAVEPFVDARAELERRRDLGLHGGMQFTYRNPERSTDPSRILDGARSLVVGAWPYAAGDPERPSDGGPWGRVARYAVVDHYAQLRAALATVAAVLEARGGRTRIVLDDNSLVDRAAAVRAGVGWFGHNTNVLVPGHGSWVVLGTIVTDLDVPGVETSAGTCGTCTRCLDGCPTGALIAPGVLDANRCLAWLVQAPGEFPLEHRVALGDRIYGCDDCQEVCPPGRRSVEAATPTPDGTWVDLVAMLTESDDELLARHGRWYIAGRDPRWLRRNALLALGNAADVDDPSVRGLLTVWTEGDDALLAEHARWALQRLDERAAAMR